MIYYVIVIIGVFLCSAAQLMLKSSASRKHRFFAGVILNWRVMVSYGIIFSALFTNIYAMKHGVMLKDMPILEATGYIFVPLLSHLFLSERISKYNISSIVLIILGIIIFYI